MNKKKRYFFIALGLIVIGIFGYQQWRSQQEASEESSACSAFSPQLKTK